FMNVYFGHILNEWEHIALIPLRKWSIGWLHIKVPAKRIFAALYQSCCRPTVKCVLTIYVNTSVQYDKVQRQA
ncbi:hypothetical protein P4K96_32375, partial [Bacillus cereus]|nr:hypothetical protein [Bacillus cereus]